MYNDIIAWGTRYEQRLADEYERCATVQNMRVTADDDFVLFVLGLPKFKAVRDDPVDAPLRKWRELLSQFGDELQRRALCGTPLRLATILLVDPKRARVPSNYKLVPRIVWACAELVRCRRGANDDRAFATFRDRMRIRAVMETFDQL